MSCSTQISTGAAVSVLKCVLYVVWKHFSAEFFQRFASDALSSNVELLRRTRFAFTHLLKDDNEVCDDLLIV